jgi:hypothetical protein
MTAAKLKFWNGCRHAKGRYTKERTLREQKAQPIGGPRPAGSVRSAHGRFVQQPHSKLPTGTLWNLSLRRDWSPAPPHRPHLRRSTASARTASATLG